MVDRSNLRGSVAAMLKHRRIHSGLYWNSKLKRRSFTEITGDAYLASVRFDHLLNDSQTQSQSTSVFTVGFQFIENLFDSFFAITRAGISNPAPDDAIGSCTRSADPALAVTGVSDRI